MSNFKKTFDIRIPYNFINDKLNNQIKDKINNFSMPGFSKGNVPISIIKEKFGQNIFEFIIQSEISIIIKNIINKKRYNIYEKPNVKILSFDNLAGLICKVELNILPNIPKINWKKISINKYNIIVSKQEIEIAKNNILKDFKTFVASNSEYKSQIGDKVKFIYSFKINASDPFSSFSDEIDIIIGNNNFIENFDFNLINVKKLDIKVFNFIFPKNYPNHKIASKNSIFKVKIINIMKSQNIKKISFDILNKIGVDNEQEFNLLVLRKIKLKFLHPLRLKMKRDLSEQIDNNYSFNIPINLIKSEIKKNFSIDIVNNIHYHKYKKNIIKRIKLGLLISNIIKENNIKISQEELKKFIDIEFNRNSQKLDINNNNIAEKKLSKIKNQYLEEKAFDIILKKININNINISTKLFIEKIIPQIKI